MGKLKLGVKLIIYITVLIVLSMVIIGLLTFFKSKEELLNKVAEKLYVINTHKINQIESYVGNVESCFEIMEKDKNLLNNISSYGRTLDSQNDTVIMMNQAAESRIRERLSSVREAFNLSRIMILTPKGKKIWGSNVIHYLEEFDNDNFNPSSKLFINAKHQLTFSDIYRPRYHENEFYMTAMYPIKDVNNITTKVVACEINLKPLYEAIADTAGLGETGETFITKRISGKKVMVLSPLRNVYDAALKKVVTIGDATGLEIQNSVIPVENGQFRSELDDYNGNPVDVAYNYIDRLDWGIVTKIDHAESFKAIDGLRHWIIFLCAGIIFFAIIIIAIFVKRFLKPIIEIRDNMISLAEGDFPEDVEYDNYDEIYDTAEAMNEFVHRLKVSTDFAQKIGEGEIVDERRSLLLGSDVLSKSLLAMKENLSKVEEDNDKRKWVSEGIAIHSDVLRNNSSNIKDLGDALVSSLVRYVGAHHGGVFVIHDTSENATPYYELVATYAYEVPDGGNTKFRLGQGLVGQCALEKETIYLQNTPSEFTKISSALGSADAGNVLIVPLKLHEQVFGVLELASFSVFEPHKIEFIEKIGETVASAILAVKSNERTQKLLKESQYITDNLRKKEEELKIKQNVIEGEQEQLQGEFKKAQITIQKLKKEKKELESALKNKKEDKK